MDIKRISMTRHFRCTLTLLLWGLCQVATIASVPLLKHAEPLSTGHKWSAPSFAMAQTQVSSPVFTPASCDFSSPMTVEISAEGDNAVYYSTDGSTPTVSEKYKYNGAFVISSTTTVYAIAADADGNVSQVVSAKYTCTRHGIGEGYNPSSPGNPGSSEEEIQEKTYRLTVVANPSGAGSVYSSSNNLKAGARTHVYAYNKGDFVFKNWTIEGVEVSSTSSFYYVMPKYDVTIVANYDYNPTSPGNPSPEEQKVKHPVVVRSIPSIAASMSPSGTFDMEENSSRQVYAYPNTGWKLIGWTINGEQQLQVSSPLSVSMGEKALDIAAYFSYEPSSPSNPGANYYNPTTGQVIVDDFASGNLYNALSNLVGYGNFSNISSLIVKGQITSNDLGNLSSLSNAETIDLSRTGGVASIPSYTFESSGVSSIVLPSTITSIGSGAFYCCANLTSLTVYAQEPPTCNSSTFSNFTNKENCTVYVPESAIELYASAEYWKDFTILPITNDAHVLQVNLPENASDGRYKYNSLEIVNINSGVRQKYVISDRMLYTFNGLQKDEQYNIYMFSQTGLELGRIENVVIPNQDIEISFDNLKSLHTVFAKVIASDGSDVTSQVTVEWFNPLADGTMTYLRKATSLGEIPEGQQLICRISLDNTLGVAYLNPADREFTVTDESNICTINLTPFRSVELSGVVVDGDGVALPGASVSVTQTLNGKYFRTYTAKTDRKGQWSMSVLDATETNLIYAAAECVNVNETIGAFEENVDVLDLGKATMKSIVGARVKYGFTYRAAGAEEAESYYSDYQNVAVSVYNVTQNRAHEQISLQYPEIAVLDENINEGDQLKLVATSKTGAFNPIEQIVTVGENQRAEVTFEIVGKGGISAMFEMTDNPAVIAMLYSDKGELLKKVTYSEAKAVFTELEDGEYTLVSMGQSDLMNSILRLSNFSEIGLTEGKDYVKNSVKVESGKLADVKIPEVPAFDESLFYYTNSATSFSVNKSSITTGNYLTLRSAIDFKGVYKNDISNVVLIVDLPEACEFVEQSVIQGPNLLPYTLDNKRLTVQLGGNYQSQTRFCVVPTTGGTFNATASIVFDYNGKTLTQSIGSASSEIKDIEITVPSVIAGTTFKVSGTALGNSTINIYENETLLGNGKANAAGLWNVECELSNPYNLSTHSIYAEITTVAGNTLISENKDITYDINALQVSKVTMYHWNPEMSKTYESVFDFLNPKTTATQWTVYYPNKKFTYTIEFTDNNPERISNVVLYVHTADGRFVPLKASFDEDKGLWYAEIDMGSSSNGYYPVNCSVDFDYTSPFMEDCKKVHEDFDNISSIKEKYQTIANQISEKEQAAEQIETEMLVSEPKQVRLVEEICKTDGPSVELVEQLLSEIAGESVSIDVSVPDEITDDFVEFILGEMRALTGDDTVLADKTDYNLIADEIEAGLSGMSEESKEAILLMIQDELVLESDDGNMTIKKMSVDEWKSTGYAVDESIDVDLTNGQKVTIYLNDLSMYVADESADVVYVINQQQNVEKLNGLLKASVRSDFISRMKAAANEIRKTISKLHSFFAPLIDKMNDELDEVKSSLSHSKIALGTNTSLLHQTEDELRRVESVINRLDNKGVDATIDEKIEYGDRVRSKEMLLKRKSELSRRVKDLNRSVKRLDRAVKSLDAKLISGMTVLGNLRDAYECVSGLYRLIDYTIKAGEDYSKWNAFIQSVKPCPNDEAAAENLVVKSENDRNEILWRTGYVPAVAITGLTTAVQSYLMVNKGAALIARMVSGLLLDFVNDFAKTTFDKTVVTSKNRYNVCVAEKNQLQCNEKNCGQPGMPPCPGDGDGGNGGSGNGNGSGNGGANGSGSPDDDVQIDPAGYVYEAVPTNRVEGVQASIYYKETKEDMYGDPLEEIVLWDAEKYAQQNPLFTDENGMYRWDVPQGLWQVKFEKEGYETAYSEWLPVPPPQLEVNIGIVQNKQPEVTEARAYEEGVEVQFDKFMDQSTLTTDNIYVTANGEKLKGEIRLIDSSIADEYASEDDADATRYTSRVRFVPEEKLSTTTGEIRVTVSRNVLSYAGKPMTETFSQALDVEKEVKAITADDMKVLYGGEKEVTVYALPYGAAVGRKLRIANSSELIASVDAAEATLDEEGKAVVKVKGDLPGRAQLTFTIDDVTATGACAVDVVTEIITAEAPKASRASGTAVYRGTKVELTTESDNSTIYFTTDGSCPCDENGTRRKYTVPIIIDEDTRILAMTSVGTNDDDVSEVVEFNYTLKQLDMDFQIEEGWTWISHIFDKALAPTDLASDEGVSRILSQTKDVIRDPQFGLVGTLAELPASESYKVQTSAATARKRLSGIAWNPATPIAIKTGWNWLGYPVGQTMSVNEALATTKAEKLDVVVGQNGFAQFDGENWIGTLETMSPGMGYMYQSQSAKNVVYNTSIVSMASAKYACGISAKSPLVLDIHKFKSVMPVVATLSNADGTQLDNAEYQVAAFCDTECRGIGRVVNGLVMMNVYGDVNDHITFHVTDADGELSFANNASLKFEETIVGSVFNPYTITLDGATSVTDVAYSGKVKVIVEGGVLRISGVAANDINLVEVYDINGQKLISRSHVSESGISISTLIGGVYVVIVNGKGEYTYHKIVVQ